MSELLEFYAQNYPKLLDQLWEHISLTVISVSLACALSIPMGIWIAKKQRMSSTVLNATGILQTIPSIALLGFLIPLMGIGMKPAIFALFLYSLLPILRNVYTGITEIESSIIESAKGMGLSFWQILFKVELPLALPTIFAGIRTATVINVGVATLAAYIAAGGLGEFIFGGIALNNSTMIIAGALPAALLAILLDFLLGRLQQSRFRKMKRNLGFAGILVVLGFGITAFDLTSETKLKAGFTPEFVGRADGLAALKKTYELKISNVALGPALMYKAIHEDYVDVISGYSTDGRIKSYNLRVLKDDKQAFPPYQAGLLVRQDVWEKHPDLRNALSILEGQISDSLMTHLNFLVDQEKRSVRDVARKFLQSKQLLGEATEKQKGVLIIGSKIFTEQYILTEIYQLLIESHTGFEVQTKKGLGGTKICFDALRQGEIDMYPEYSGTALQVLLDLEHDQKHSPDQIFDEVQRQLTERYALHFTSPLGFDNTYALMMREEQARNFGIKNITDLRNHLKP